MKLLHLVAADKDNTHTPNTPHTNNISNMSSFPDQNTNPNPNTTPNPGNTTTTPPADINTLVVALQHLAIAMTPTTGRSSSNTTFLARLSVKLPSYKGAPSENIYMWCMQLSAIFNA